jgi:hypothetical protein
MFCPSCGIEDQSSNQFCRSCGMALNVVRSAVEQPDAVTSSAVTAREEIGRAIASKIGEFENTNELRQAVYEILPVIESFLESPEERRLHQQEKRLNQIREGALTSVVGLAILLCFALLSWVTNSPKVLIAGLAGLLVFLIGLGITVTAYWFTTLPKSPGSSQRIPKQTVLHEKRNTPIDNEPPSAHSTFPSITEGTTREL